MSTMDGAFRKGTEKVELVGRRAGGWFVATMARLLCPGSTAPSSNQPSGLSHETLMQVPATTGTKKDK